jgi:hypothetical protein
MSRGAPRGWGAGIRVPLGFPRLLGTLGLLLAFHAATTTTAAAAAPPKLTFAEQAIAGSGFSPGGQVIWLAVARVVAEDYYVTLSRFQSVTSAAADGTARDDLGQPLPSTSLWLAVDLTTGAYSLASPSGAPPRVAVSPTLRVGSGTTSDLVEDRRQSLSALLVRPGVGAWGLTVADGSAADEDGAGDGHLQFSLARMSPLAVAPSAAGGAGGAGGTGGAGGAGGAGGTGRPEPARRSGLPPDPRRRPPGGLTPLAGERRGRRKRALSGPCPA